MLEFAIDDNKDSDTTNTHGKESKVDKKITNDFTETEQSKSNLCSSCGKEVNENVAKFSNQKFKKTLCIDCQKKFK